MKDFDKIEQLLMQKAYNELNNEEKMMADEYFDSSESYEAIRQQILVIGSENEGRLNPKIKHALMSTFKTNHQPVWLRALNFKTPAYANLAVVFLLVFGFWFLIPEKERYTIKTETVQLPGTVDTLIVQLPPDTIVVEKIVKIMVEPKPIELVAEERENQGAEEKSLEGVTLAEQKDLRALIVSAD